MTAKNWILVALLGISVYRRYPVTEHKILALVNTATYNVSRISQIQNLMSAFKIERNIDDKLGIRYHAEQKAKVNIKICFISIVFFIR